MKQRPLRCGGRPQTGQEQAHEARRAEIARLRAEIARLRAEIERLRAAIAAIESFALETGSGCGILKSAYVKSQDFERATLWREYEWSREKREAAKQALAGGEDE